MELKLRVNPFNHVPSNMLLSKNHSPAMTRLNEHSVNSHVSAAGVSRQGSDNDYYQSGTMLPNETKTKWTVHRGGGYMPSRAHEQ